MQEHSGYYGKINRFSIPPAEDDSVKGIAFINYNDNDAASKALELDGSELGNSYLKVQEANPRAGGSNSGGLGRSDSGGFGRARGRSDYGGRGSRGCANKPVLTTGTEK